MQKTDEKDSRGFIAVMRGGGIGDFVLTLPAIHALRRFHRDSGLCLIAHPPLASLISPEMTIDHSSPLLAPLYLPHASPPPKTSALFAEIDFLLAYAPDPEGILEANLRALVRGTAWVHDPRPPSEFAGHATDYLLQPLHRLGLPVGNPEPHLELGEEARAYALACWQQYQFRAPTIALHPGSGGRHKNWPLDYFLRLKEHLQRRGLETFFILGPAEEEDQRRLPDSAICLRPPGLLELAGLLSQVDLFVGNDSGPAHLAAAVGTPTLSLFGPTDPRRWCPRSSKACVLQAPAGQLSALAVDSVFEAVLAILESLYG